MKPELTGRGFYMRWIKQVVRFLDSLLLERVPHKKFDEKYTR